jgi:hypothetical protein
MHEHLLFFEILVSGQVALVAARHDDDRTLGYAQYTVGREYLCKNAETTAAASLPPRTRMTSLGAATKQRGEEEVQHCSGGSSLGRAAVPAGRGMTKHQVGVTNDNA